MSTKSQKQNIKSIITSANISADLNISTALFPDGKEALDDVYSNAKNSKASVLITYSGKKYLPKANIYSIYSAFTIFIFSKTLQDDSVDPLDIELLVDSITEILYLNGYELFEEGVRPVIDKKTGLFEAVIIVGKNGVYPN